MHRIELLYQHKTNINVRLLEVNKLKDGFSEYVYFDVMEGLVTKEFHFQELVKINDNYEFKFIAPGAMVRHRTSDIKMVVIEQPGNNSSICAWIFIDKEGVLHRKSFEFKDYDLVVI